MQVVIILECCILHVFDDILCSVSNPHYPLIRRQTANQFRSKAEQKRTDMRRLVYFNLIVITQRVKDMVFPLMIGSAGLVVVRQPETIRVLHCIRYPEREKLRGFAAQKIPLPVPGSNQ